MVYTGPGATVLQVIGGVHDVTAAKRCKAMVCCKHMGRSYDTIFRYYSNSDQWLPLSMTKQLSVVRSEVDQPT